MASARVALLAGATGLTGKHLLELLLADNRYASVHAFVRKNSLPAHPKLSAYRVDFESFSKLPKADDAFCCLGTTIKKAGSQAAFRKVDFDYVLNFATAAQAAGVKRFSVVSSLGANAKSAVFYNRIKGEMEQALMGMGFESLTLIRPSFLVGERPDARVGEKIGIAVFSALAPMMIGPVRKIRPIAAEDVAMAMLVSAGSDAPGVTILESDQITRSRA